MEIEFKSLIKLQDLDEKIKKLSLFLDSIPSQIDEINWKIENSVEIVSRTKEKLNANQKSRRDLEADVQDIKSRIAKYKQQLNNVKTNKEYSSLLKEIEDADSLIAEKEELILEEMLSADEIENEIRTAEKKAEEIKQEFSREKELLKQKAEEKEEEKKTLLNEKDRISPTIPEDQLNLYNTIFQKKSGIALSPVTDDFCSMCQIRIRPQVLNELIAQNAIILCENCGRILYMVKTA